MEFKELWDIESAMQVLADSNVDSRLWAEAVEWLILHGPEEIRQLLLQSSLSATQNAFPDLQPSSYSEDGQPCYKIDDLANALQMESKEAQEILMQKEAEHGSLDLLEIPEKSSVH